MSNSKFTPEQFIFKVEAVPQATFTVVAATDVITSTAHGLTNGDCVWVSSSTTLPAGLSASTNYYIINATTDTFRLSAVPSGTNIDITDTGTGTHTYKLKGKTILISDYSVVTLGVFTSGSANFTLKVQISDQGDVDFNKSQSATNRWDYAQVKLMDDNSSVNGSTGVVTSGTDINKTYEVNINKRIYLSANFTAWSAGKANVVVRGYNN